MAGVEEKFAAFSKLVLEMANKQRDSMSERLQEEIDRSVERQEKEFTENAREDMEKEILRKLREDNEKILKTEAALKRKLLIKRESIINEIFGDVDKRVEEFTQSGKYEGWLKEKVESGIKELGADDCVIRMMRRDERYKDMIEKASGCKAELSDEDFTGGLKIYSGNKCVDYSLSALTEKARAEFLRNTDLSVSQEAN
ncbi:MAG: hypothetical protein J1F64_05735 [Oscillospiraceae bacterium]|nr:hypothetical protein [Oscillospiraceae bacterium]